MALYTTVKFAVLCTAENERNQGFFRYIYSCKFVTEFKPKVTMRSSNLSKPAAWILLASFLFTACKKEEEGCTDPEALNFNPDATVDDGSCEYPSAPSAILSFTHEVDGEPLELNSVQYVNLAGNEYSVQRLRYIVSDFTFYKSSGEHFTINDVHLRNHQEDDSRQYHIEELPAGTYDKHSFVFGLNEDKNKPYAYHDREGFAQMNWPGRLGSEGYHYMQIDGRYKTDEGELYSYGTHTGRLVFYDQNNEDSARYENYFTVELDDVVFKISDGQTLQLELIMNVNAWYEPEHYDFSDYNGIMHNQQAQEIIRENGANVFSAGTIEIE
jgi:hypothetical protein